MTIAETPKVEYVLQFSYFVGLNQEQQEMNAENFADFLNDKSNLYKLSYQELKTLALQYPYSANLQLLLTLKSKMEQHKDFDKNLAKAATLCPDRSHLLQRIQSIEVNTIMADHFLLKEDYLELKDLSQIETLDKIPLEPAAETKTNGQAEIPDTIKTQLQHDSEQDPITDNNPFLNSSGKDYEDINLSDTLFNELLTEEEPEAATQAVLQPVSQIAPEPEPEVEPEPITLSEPLSQPYAVSQDTILNLVAITKILQVNLTTETVITKPVKAEGSEHKSESKRPKPSPKSSFTSWVQQFQPDHTKLRLAELMEAKKLEELKRKKKLKAKKKKKKKKKKSKVIVIAQKSITENTEIATETLAKLLTSQGQYEKAIQVYHRLNVMYPQQKDYFDQKVLALQTLLEED